ncbi:MAG: hypothetical protein ACYDAI_11570 [Trichloromonadaceae bacterium]
MGIFDFLFEKKNSGNDSNDVSVSPSMPTEGEKTGGAISANDIELDNPIYNQGCSRVGDGLLHLDWARKAARSGDTDRARVEYLKAAESWKQANVKDGGKWGKEVDAANKEYAAFVETDPSYKNGLATILPIIRANPGILQTDVYKALPEMPRETASYVLYFAASTGVVERSKKGRTYELRVK